MKRKHFSEDQIVTALKRVDSGESTATVSRELGISQQTLYNWKDKYGGMEVSDLTKLKRLQTENSRLKRAVADLTLDNQMLRDLNARK